MTKSAVAAESALERALDLVLALRAALEIIRAMMLMGIGKKRAKRASKSGEEVRTPKIESNMALPSLTTKNESSISFLLGSFGVVRPGRGIEGVGRGETLMTLFLFSSTALFANN